MKRRNFIIYSAVSAVAAGLPFAGCSVPDKDLHKKLAVPEVLSQTYDENTIRKIGDAYGKSFPNEYNIADLEQALKKGQEGKMISTSTSNEEMQSILDQKVKDDFHSGQTIILDGIILSKTEAMQCALFTLISPSH